MIGDRLIGSDQDGGLSLEQRKRTTLGVELAANPSIIFLGAGSSDGIDHLLRCQYPQCPRPTTRGMGTLVCESRPPCHPDVVQSGHPGRVA